MVALCYTRASTHQRPCTHTKAHTHAQARKDSHTHSEKYVIHIAFPRRQWLHERASVVHYMYTACLACFKILQHGRKTTNYVLKKVNSFRASSLTQHKIFVADFSKLFPSTTQDAIEHCILVVN